MAQITTQNMPRWRTSHTLTYDIKNYRKKHNINIMAGFEAMRETSTLREMKSYQLPADMAIDDIFANMAFRVAGVSLHFRRYPVAMASFFGRVNYSYRNKYLVTATVRIDGSSKFAPVTNGVVSPRRLSPGASPKSRSSNRAEWIDDLKLRVSYGEAGNNRIANDMWRRTFKGDVHRTAEHGGRHRRQTQHLPLTNSSSVLINEDLVWKPPRPATSASISEC